MQNGLREMVLQGEGSRRSEPAELVGMRPLSSSPGQYRGSVQGQVELARSADLHAHASGFGARSCDNDFMFPSSITQMLPHSGGIRHMGFWGHSSHLMPGCERKSLPRNNSCRTTSTHSQLQSRHQHVATRHVATGGSPAQGSRTTGTRLEQHHLVPQVKRKWTAAAGSRSAPNTSALHESSTLSLPHPLSPFSTHLSSTALGVHLS